MPYVKQKFVDHETKLKAAHLEYIEDGIIRAFAEIPKFKVKTLNILADGWVGSNGLFSQVVGVEGVTRYSKVDLLPSPEQLNDLFYNEISLVAANSAGSITVFAIGGAPTTDYEMQALITEVTIE